MLVSGNILYQFRSRLHGYHKDAAWHAGWRRPFMGNKGDGRILLYHGVCKTDPLRFNTLFIKAKTFEAQLRLYKKYYNLISLDDFYQQRFDTGKFNLTLTFDDGFANNYRYVLPLLEQYKVPATFFITGIRKAGYNALWNDVLSIAYQYGPATLVLGKDKYVKGKGKKYLSLSTGQYLVEILRAAGFNKKAEMIELLGSYCQKASHDYWMQMTQEEIRFLSASKWVTIGAHGYYHSDLAKIPAASANEEMSESKQFLENITGREIRALAFPYGSYTRETAALAKKIGYSQMLATEFLFDEDRTDTTFRERLTINPFISNVNQLHANVTGHYKQPENKGL